jgi:forkhead box protein K
MERCSDAKRKGFFWSVDEKFESTFEEQEARTQASKSQDNESGKDGKWTKKKDRRHGSVLEPPLKRSVKSDPKGGALPPPLTSTPLAPKPPTSFGLNTHDPTPLNPASTQTPLASGSTSTTTTGISNGDTNSSSIPTLPPSLFIPIVVGPIPPSHPSSSASTDSTKTNPLASTAIVLHESTLILNPEVFSHLTPEQVKELEALGAQKALEILQGYIARFLKEQRLKKRDGVRGRGRGRGAPKRGRGGAAMGEGTPANASADKSVHVNPGPFTTIPLPRRDVKPLPDGDTSHKSAEEVHLPVNTPLSMPVNAEPPAPSSTVVDNSVEPIIVVDDSDSSEAPVAKRRKLDALVIPPEI